MYDLAKALAGPASASLMTMFIERETRVRAWQACKMSNLKVFILPRVVELFIHKEKQRGCPLLGANRYTHIYISYICVYI